MLALDRHDWQAEMRRTLARIEHRPTSAPPQRKPAWRAMVLATASLPLIGAGTWLGAMLFGLVAR